LASEESRALAHDAGEAGRYTSGLNFLRVPFDMQKFIASLQLILSLLVFVAAAATIHNLYSLASRPETISVVNTLIGQGVLIIGLLVISRVLFTRGLARWRAV